MLKAFANEPLLSPLHAVIIFLSFLIAVILVLFCKKLYFRYRWHKRYYIFPRLEIKGITNVAMTISLSIAVIMLLTIVTSGTMGILFRAYPGWRVIIEGILIQLGGSMFGPIIGLFIGGITDILSICLTAGMFHYGYFIVGLAYGLFSGLFKSLLIKIKDDAVKFAMYATLILIVVAGSGFGFIMYQKYEYFNVSILSYDIKIYKSWLAIILASTMAFFGVLIWILMLVFRTKSFYYLTLKWKYNIWYSNKNKRFMRRIIHSKKKTEIAYKQLKWYTKHIAKIEELRLDLNKIKNDARTFYSRKNWFDYLCPVIFSVVITNFITNVFMLPFFDINFSAFQYDYWLTIRVLLYPIMVIANLVVVYPSYRVAGSLINYNYRNDVLENINSSFLEQ